MSNPVSSTLISEVVSRATSFLTSKCSEHKSVPELIHRLEMASIEIKCVIEDSEASDIDIESSLHKWREKLREVLSEADETLSSFKDRTDEGGSSSHDQSMQEEGSGDATLAHPASNLREAKTRQVNLEANVPDDQSMQEEGSDDATLAHPASNLREAETRQVNLEANVPDDQSMQEEGSDDATLEHPASNQREAETRQVDLEANVPNDQSMQEEGSDDATLAHPASNLREAVTRQVDLEAKLPHDQSMQEEGSDNATLVHSASNRSMQVSSSSISWLSALGLCFLTGMLLNPLMMFRTYLENDEKVSKLKQTVEKLEKMAGDIGRFIELLEKQSKRNMCRKRKRSARPCQSRGFFLVLSLKLQAYALFCYGEDAHLLVIKLFRAKCNMPTGITSDIFIGFIM